LLCSTLRFQSQSKFGILCLTQKKRFRFRYVLITPSSYRLGHAHLPKIPLHFRFHFPLQFYSWSVTFLLFKKCRKFGSINYRRFYWAFHFKNLEVFLNFFNILTYFSLVSTEDFSNYLTRNRSPILAVVRTNVKVLIFNYFKFCFISFLSTVLLGSILFRSFSIFLKDKKFFQFWIVSKTYFFSSHVISTQLRWQIWIGKIGMKNV
jgi:hypothetical protein